MAVIKKLSRKENKNFEVANAFVDYYMAQANPTYVTVYLCGLRLLESNSEVTYKIIADKLSILESDVVKAFDYWEKAGVVKINGGVLEYADLSHEHKAKEEKQGVPSYFPKELTTYEQEDPNVKGLFDFAKQRINKLITFNELATIYSFYDYYKLPFEVIYLLIEYCCSMNKVNVKYMEKVAITWKNEGITTIDKAEEYVQEADRRGASKKTKAGNKFVNFKPHSMNYEELDRFLREKRAKRGE